MIRNQVYFGAAGYPDFTIHKDEERKSRYIKRHNNEKWIGVLVPMAVMESNNNKCKLSRY